jgi:hypothetical protein
VFVGFSLKDGDIKRLIGRLPPNVKERIHFVTSPSESKPAKDRFSRFGNLHLMGYEGFAKHLDHVRCGLPSRTSISLPTSLRALRYEHATSRNVSSGAIDYLVVAGILQRSVLSQADLEGAKGAYSFKRSDDHYRRATTFANARPILVHSDIGNGKTVFLEKIGYKLSSEGYQVYQLIRESPVLDGVIRFLQSSTEKTVIIADDLLRFGDLVAAINRLGRANLHVVAGVRSTVLKVAPYAIRKRLGSDSWTEIDLNVGSDKESLYIRDYLDENGLFGKLSELSNNQRRDLIRFDCKGQVRDVILTLFENGALHERVQGLLEAILDMDPSTRDIITLGALITVSAAPEFGRLDIMSEALGYNGTSEELRDGFAKRELIGPLLIENGQIIFRSPMLAQFLLMKVFSFHDILKVAKNALFGISTIYGDDVDFDRFSRALLRFSLIGKFIQRAEDEDAIDSFYEQC